MSYVGLTRYTVEKRLKEHLNDHRNYYIDNTLRKYGVSNFNVIVLEEVEKYRLSERQLYWIKRINCVYPKSYYNTYGGEECFSPSAETKHKIS